MQVILIALLTFIVAGCPKPAVQEESWYEFRVGDPVVWKCTNEGCKRLPQRFCMVYGETDPEYAYGEDEKCDAIHERLEAERRKRNHLDEI